jgi:hypothetical protein
MFIDAACTKNADGADFLIFREHCSGSACIETIYGIYDPSR